MTIVTSLNKQSLMIRVLLSIIAIVALALFSCTEDDSVKDVIGGGDQGGTGGGNVSWPATALYVSSTGNGSGSAQSPFPTIQQALDSAIGDTSITHILVAIGDYNESLEIGMPIAIIGSLDPASKWSLLSSERTTINGQQIEGLSIAVSIRDIIGTVYLEQLHIKGSDAVESGATSIGVYSSNVSSVQFVNCQVLSGLGMAGRDGFSGQAGAKGDSAYYRLAGQSPVTGGNGGFGQDSFDQTAEPGEQGFCANGTQTGGVPGVNGNRGNIGLGGDGGVSDLVIVAGTLFSLPLTESGRLGQTGQPGCGGGGGDGTGGTFGHTGFEPGGIGGGGGAGGFGGEGGSGGYGGGSTIGIFIKGGSLIAKDSPILTSGGGIGGSGGIGGIGGSGGKGARGIWIARSTGGTGGNGGQGGRGGHGGGGAGGWSIGILAYQAQINVDTAKWVHPGFAGIGGSGGNFPAPRGESGKRVKLWSIN